MDLKITPQNWSKYVANQSDVTAIGNDYFMLIEDLHLLPEFDFPFKVNMMCAVICTRGVSRYRINFKLYESKAPFILSILQNQTVQKEYISDDYQGYAIVMSQQFIDSLFHDTRQRMQVLLQAGEHPYRPMTDNELNLFLSFYDYLKKVVALENTPNRIEILRHMTLTFIYLSNYYDNLSSEHTVTPSKNILKTKFLELVKENFKHERQMSFYADKLCLTPKYLSQKIRQQTGKSANEWIEEHVAMEAKALLKSTNMTVEQISEELNFPSPSFFGKYFKRVVGISARQYKGT